MPWWSRCAGSFIHFDLVRDKRGEHTSTCHESFRDPCHTSRAQLYMNDRNFESLYWLVIFVSPLFATGEAGITGAWHSSKPYLFAPCLPRLRVRHHIHDTITTRPAWFVLGKPSVPWSIHPRLPYTSAKSSWGTVFRAACFLHLCSRCTRGRSYR